MGEFNRLPPALLCTHILEPSSAFALGQAAAAARALVYDHSMADLWQNLNVQELLSDREQFRQQSTNGSTRVVRQHQSTNSGSQDSFNQESEEQMALLLLRLVPAVASSFCGVATDGVLEALRLKFTKTLQELQVLKKSVINPQPLLSLAQSMGSGLKVLQLSCPFELRPGFLATLAATCPNLADLSFSSNTRVLPLADRWQADPGMMRHHPDNTQQLQQQKYRHAFTLELFELLVGCPGLVALHLPPGMHVCNGVLLAVRRWSHCLRRLQGARVNFLSGEGLTWPAGIEQEYSAYLSRQRASAGLPPVSDKHQAADSKALADLTYQTFDDVVRYMGGRTGGMQLETSSNNRSDCTGGWVIIDDIAGRRLRIDMQYNAVWGAI